MCATALRTLNSASELSGLSWTLLAFARLIEASSTVIALRTTRSKGRTTRSRIARVQSTAARARQKGNTKRASVDKSPGEVLNAGVWETIPQYAWARRPNDVVPKVAIR